MKEPELLFYDVKIGAMEAVLGRIRWIEGVGDKMKVGAKGERFKEGVQATGEHGREERFINVVKVIDIEASGKQTERNHVFLTRLHVAWALACCRRFMNHLRLSANNRNRNSVQQ